MSPLPVLAPGQLPIAPILDGVHLGVMLSLAAVGLTLIFGFLGILNFAHGALYMLGGYTLVTVTGATGNFWLGLLAAPLAVGALALVFEMSFLRTTYEFDPLVQMLITFGFTLVIEGSVLVIWDSQDKTLLPPDLLSGQFEVLGITYPVYKFSLIFLGGILIVLTWLAMRYTRIGLLVRASLADREMVQAHGVEVNRLYTLVFVYGVALTALAGALMVPQRGVGPETGSAILLDTFIVVVIGGLGSYRGTVTAGMLVGLVSVFATKYVSFRLSELAIFVVLILVLVVRPRGLFGTKGVFTDE